MEQTDIARAMPNGSSPLPWLIVAGQPSASQLGTAAAGGVATVIDLRDPMEPRGYDEAAEAARLGMRYVNVPVVSGGIGDSQMDRVLSAMRESRGSPTLLHCSSANRTGGPLLAYLLVDEKMDDQAAFDLALRSGLRSAEYLEWATDYARRHQAAR